MDQIFVCNLNDLKSLLNELEERIIEQLKLQSYPKKFSEEWLSLNDVSIFLKISITTVHSWSKQGILTKHKIGRKTRFKKEEVLSALTKLEARNHRICKK